MNPVNLLLSLFAIAAFFLAVMLVQEIRRQQRQLLKTPIKSKPPQGKELQRALAQSRKDHIGKSEYWHQQNAANNPVSLVVRSAAQMDADEHAICAAEQQLLGMLQNDRETAVRLLESTKRSYRGASVQWVLEKVIADLERDQRV
jgi:hypothetical protein